MQTHRNIIISALEANDLESVATFAKEDKKVLSKLVRLAYDKETLTGWRAIKAVGFAARALLPIDYPFLREMVRKLLWSLSDESGGIGWSAPEMLGEIVSADPHRFGDIIPLIAEVYSIEERNFRPGVLYALTRIAETEPGLILEYKDLVLRALADEDPLVRVYGVELAKILAKRLTREENGDFSMAFEKLKTDFSEVWIYRHDEFMNVQVKETVPMLYLAPSLD